ncbi:MAG: glycerophosphodiester phosphodiesterase family protein [Mangrovicoccus sp.]
MSPKLRGPQGPALLPAFFDRPLAHRGYHDLDKGRPENSQAAFAAACAAGYGIELDLQLSRDGVAMAFHDEDLTRLTGRTGAVSDLTAAELAALPLLGTAEQPPRLSETLALVAGRAPLLIELKSQSTPAANRALAKATAQDLSAYAGPVALMSFDPQAVESCAEAAPGLPRGLTTAAEPYHWPNPPQAWPPNPADYQASFLSHQHDALDLPQIGALKSAGHRILCWTIRSPEDAQAARAIAENITFEAFAP